MLIVKDSSSSSLELRPVEKNSLFFNQYQYSAKFSLNELGVIRGLKLDKIDQIVRERNKWRQDHQSLYSGYRNQITEHEVDNLKEVCGLLKKHEKHVKFSVSYNRGYVYTNDLKIIKKIQNLRCISCFEAQEALVICPAGTLALYNPKWTHRTYLKSRQLTPDQKTMLIDYLKGRENIRLSPALSEWMITDRGNWYSTYTHDYFFFDHNNDGEVLFINMVMSRITGRTLQIVAK